MKPTTEPDPVAPRPKPPVASLVEKPRRAKHELTELLEAAARILPEHADKLGQFVDSALTIWDRREKQPVRSVKDATLAPTAPFARTGHAKQLARNKEVTAPVGRDLDSVPTNGTCSVG